MLTPDRRDLHTNSDLIGSDPALSSALVSLRKRLDALEEENARSESKVAELEDKLAAAASSQQIPASSHQEGQLPAYEFLRVKR